MKRVNIRAILANPAARLRMMIGVIQATQAREGIETTTEQAAAAYDTVQRERERDHGRHE